MCTRPGNLSTFMQASDVRALFVWMSVGGRFYFLRTLVLLPLGKRAECLIPDAVVVLPDGC